MRDAINVECHRGKLQGLNGVSLSVLVGSCHRYTSCSYVGRGNLSSGIVSAILPAGGTDE